MKKSVLILVVAVAGIMYSGNVFAEQEKDWRVIFKPYLSAVSIDGDARLGRAVGANVDVDFGTIMDNLDSAFMIDIAAYHKSGWGVILDFGYMDLGSDISGPYGGVAKADLYQGVFEALITKQNALPRGYWEIFGGIRWWDNDIDLTVNPAIYPGTRKFSVDKDWVDVVVGVSGGYPLSENFLLLGRVDVGGFGVSSDFTATLMAGVRYRLSNIISVELQYKALWVDYEDGNRGTPGYFEYDTVTHGPLVGMTVEF